MGNSSLGFVLESTWIGFTMMISLGLKRVLEDIVCEFLHIQSQEGSIFVEKVRK